MQRIDAILNFWFGRIEETIVPSKRRARLWFGDSEALDEQIRADFSDDLVKLLDGGYAHWRTTPRGKLASIILLDQLSRHIFNGTKVAFAHDNLALEICLEGIKMEDDHQLSLIERVFFYFPLLHAEDLEYQRQSMYTYRQLADIALDETKMIYGSFLKFARHHHSLIEKFGRFPQRNAVLGRVSTKEELQYLQQQP